MAAPKKMRGRTWEDRETRLLLEKWGDENIQLRLKSCTRKRPIWQEIGDFLMACGYEDREGEACKTRLHTLVTAYRQSKDELKKTGNATPSKKPPFFDELDKILSDNPSTQPKVVINSAKIVAASSCEDEGGNIEIIPKGSSSDNNSNTGSSSSEVFQEHVLPGKKRRLSASDGFNKIDKALESFMNYQQEADRRFLEAEEERERREEERVEKRRKEDQEFFLKMMQALNK
ncbi:uncharacterized protein [Montipora capricornis]|uniref:uncharacterized protein n=1 Tax=Montipora capricornis TaxID=246305 RepID=UPI0035F1FA43